MTPPAAFPDDVPVLTDGVVTLRAHHAGDVQGLYEQAVDAVMLRWTSVPDPSTPETARFFATEVVPAGWRDGTEWAFAVEAADDTGRPRFVGSVSLRDRGEGRADVGFGAHPWARGRGFVSRGLRLLLEWGFTEKRLRTVSWWANRGNWASRKVAWRVGFTFDGTVRQWLPQRGELYDGWVGTLLAGEPLEPRHQWFEVPTVTGQSVVLRRHRDTDLPRIVEACSDPSSQFWLRSLPRGYTEQDALDFLETSREQHATARGLTWAVASPEGDELLGQVAVFGLAEGGSAEVGYWTHPAARGRGVMTEACRLAARHAFICEEDGGMGLRRLRLTAAETNLASRKVAEATGFTAVGRERLGSELGDGSVVDTVVYDLLPAELGAR